MKLTDRRKKEEKRTREDGEVDRLGLAGRSGKTKRDRESGQTATYNCGEGCLFQV